MWVKGKRMNKTWLGLSFVFGLALMLAAPVLADFQAGLDAWKRGDYEAALKEWRPLAEQGDAEAQYLLGNMYLQGLGVVQDYGEAAQWYRKAAEQGFAKGQNNLGELYKLGQGVPQDNQEALRWYRRAAEQGNAAAQYNLGEMYALGRGVPHNYIQAYMWNSLAAADGFTIAITDQYVLESFMTPAQIAEAQRLAREWKPNRK